MLIGMPFHAVLVFSLGYDFLFQSILGQCDRFKDLFEHPVCVCVCVLFSFIFHTYSSVNLLIIGNGVCSQSCSCRIELESQKSTLELVSKELNHLAAILHVYARGFEFYEVKKNFCYYF